MIEQACVDRHGTPGGPLVIAIHGAVANRKTWLPLARALPAHFELWCPDLPGHGSRRHETFTRATALETIDALVSLAGPRRVILAGDSLGGYLVLEAAALSSHGIDGVVAGGCTWSMHGVRGAIARASDLPVRIFEVMLGARRCEELLLQALSRFASAADRETIVESGLRVRARSESLAELRGADLARIVRGVRVPIAFVNGSRDWPTRAGEEVLLAAAADAELVVAPGVGHGVGLLAPSVFARAIASVARRERVADHRPLRTEAAGIYRSTARALFDRSDEGGERCVICGRADVGCDELYRRRLRFYQCELDV